MLASDPALQALVKDALQDLTRRQFDRELFEAVVKEKKLPLSERDLDAVCGTKQSERRVLDV